MKILLGVSGGIAAYKSLELVRLCKKAGWQVRVVMTKSAQAFVTPLSFQALSGEPVSTELLSETAEAAMGHIELARWAEVILIAPASANTLAKLACGIADDLLTTLCLATTAPILLAPAMNQQMWLNPVTQENLQKLASRNFTILPPASGEQACGEVGPGRLPEALELFQALENSCKHSQKFRGKTILITAGPTREAIDPVRYLGNYSSGKMGVALAEAALQEGATVIFIAGPLSVPLPSGARIISVTSAEEMYQAVKTEIANADLFISAAAVADYKIAEVSKQKIKKQENTLTLTLTKNIDILASISAQKPQAKLVGFAAETEHLLENARRKLTEKNLDAIIANPVGFHEGIQLDQQSATLLFKNGNSVVLEKQNKRNLAEKILEDLFILFSEEPHPGCCA